MVDRGFTIQDQLKPLGVNLNIPPFMEGRKQIPAEEVLKGRQIASVWIHVERAIGRIKNFSTLKEMLPLSMSRLVNQIVCVCAWLVNFQPLLFPFLNVNSLTKRLKAISSLYMYMRVTTMRTKKTVKMNYNTNTLQPKYAYHISVKCSEHVNVAWNVVIFNTIIAWLVWTECWIYYILRRSRTGIPRTWIGLTISGPKQLSKKSVSFRNTLWTSTFYTFNEDRHLPCIHFAWKEGQFSHYWKGNMWMCSWVSTDCQYMCVSYILLSLLYMCVLCAFRESASCTHISALLHALVVLRPGPNISTPTASRDSGEDDEDNQLPVTSYLCQWKPPK